MLDPETKPTRHKQTLETSAGTAVGVLESMTQDEPPTDGTHTPTVDRNQSNAQCDGDTVETSTDSSETDDPEDGLNTALLAGFALYNVGEYHAAHDPWEEVWLELPADTCDERLIHGLIQFTAAVYHAVGGNHSGATGLAVSAREYLAGLPTTFRGVDLEVIRTVLTAIEADPERLQRESPPRVRYDGEIPTPTTLDLDSLAVAIDAIADEYPWMERAVLEDAVRYAREERGTGRTRYIVLLADVVGGSPDGDPSRDLDTNASRTAHSEEKMPGNDDDGTPTGTGTDTESHRAVVYTRLRGHVERRRRKESDVDTLF